MHDGRPVSERQLRGHGGSVPRGISATSQEPDPSTGQCSNPAKPTGPPAPTETPVRRPTAARVAPARAATRRARRPTMSQRRLRPRPGVLESRQADDGATTATAARGPTPVTAAAASVQPLDCGASHQCHEARATRRPAVLEPTASDGSVQRRHACTDRRARGPLLRQQSGRVHGLDQCHTAGLRHGERRMLESGAVRRRRLQRRRCLHPGDSARAGHRQPAGRLYRHGPGVTPPAVIRAPVNARTDQAGDGLQRSRRVRDTCQSGVHRRRSGRICTAPISATSRACNAGRDNVGVTKPDAGLRRRRCLHGG